MPKKASKNRNTSADQPGPDELPLKGEKGVNIPRIKELDEAAAAYQKIKKQRCNLTPKEIEAKGVVIALIMKHADKLPKDEKGAITYRNNELLVVMKHGKDSLSVKDVEDEDVEDEDDDQELD